MGGSSFGGLRNQGSFERRIGRRAPAPDIPVTWLVPRRGAFTLSRRPRSYPGHIEDVSLTGAAVVGPTELDLAVGETVLLRVDGDDSSVVVRQVRPGDLPGLTRYGVEFAVLHPRLRALVDRALDAGSGRG